RGNPERCGEAERDRNRTLARRPRTELVALRPKAFRRARKLDESGWREGIEIEIEEREEDEDDGYTDHAPREEGNLLAGQSANESETNDVGRCADRRGQPPHGGGEGCHQHESG